MAAPSMSAACAVAAASVSSAAAAAFIKDLLFKRPSSLLFALQQA